MSDLETIMSDRPETHDQNQGQTGNAPEGQNQGQPRDDGGRFAAKQQQEPVNQTQGQPDGQATPPNGFVPIQALDSRLAKAREEYEAKLNEQSNLFQRQMAMFQQQFQRPPEPQAPKVPFIDQLLSDNGEAALDSRFQQAVRPIQQGQQNMVENFSRMMATDKFGEETVNAAYTELANRMQRNPQSTAFDHQRIMASPHPFGELVKWYRAQSALSQYGDDPAAYREKIRAEILAETQPQQAQGGGQQQAMPQSFTTGARNVGGNAPQSGGPVPLSELMGR